MASGSNRYDLRLGFAQVNTSDSRSFTDFLPEMSFPVSFELHLAGADFQLAVLGVVVKDLERQRNVIVDPS